MAEGIAFSIVGKLVECTVDPVLRQIKYLFFYNSNIQNLQNKVQELENKRNDVRLQVGAVERNTEIIGEEISAWLLKVDDLKEKAHEILNSVAGSEMRCLFNRCPNLKSRYLLSRRATKKTIEADMLIGEGTFERVGYPRPPVQELNLTSHEGFKTRLSTKKKIKGALKDKDIGIIGIYGMPGVGKTTMAKEIVNEVKVEKLFDEAAFAVVSNDPDINKIQDQLAEALGLKIEEKTNKDARAGRLHERLNNDKSILVVLDDLWKKIDLGTIGIPSPNGQNRLKIMFTTQREDTCVKMEAKKFKIEVLSKEEGWQLFTIKAGISDDETDGELVSLAKEVANECGRLPLALEVVGSALKGKKAVYEWKDALRQLKMSIVDVYKFIRLNYDYLVSNEERDLLLLCSLFAEDESIPIENLVRYAKGLELFKETETLCETRARAKTIANNLKSCNLLQLGVKEDEVKLHDVIRDFCLHMAIKEKCGYMVKHAGLKEWPEPDADKSYSAISITFDELDQLPSGLKYRNVKLLRVICSGLGECNISEEFFKDMKDLRVLELKRMYIQIPSSIQLLTGLQTLCLIGCRIHSQLSMIGNLKKLEILSLDGSSFDDYSPIEFTNLCNLRSLDLRFYESSCPLRPGVLSGMKKLEELCLGRYIPIEGEDAKILKNVVSELDENGFINLKKLFLSSGDFEYLIDATNSIPNGTFGKLESLELGDLPKLIEICNGNLPRGVIKPQLFCNLMTVKMKGCYKIRSLFPESIANSLVNLRRLSIDECPMLEEVVSTDARENEVTKACKMLEFPKLKEVRLTVLSSFKSFASQSNGGVAHQTLFNQVNFPHVEELDVQGLDCIVKLLGKETPITSSLHKLTAMWVLHCIAVEVLFDFEGIKVTYDDADINMLGRLTSLWLSSLPKLVHITRMVPKGIRVFQNLKNLDVEACESLRYLFSPSIVNSLVALEHLSIARCEALEEIIGREEEENTSENRNIVMDANTLSNLHHFTQVISMDAKRNEDMLEFPKLNRLELHYLSNFKSFRSESNNDAILRTLFNRVTFPNMEELNVRNLDCIVKLLGKEMPTTSLPKLKDMWVLRCYKLLAIAESDSIQLLQNLEILLVRGCNALKVLFDFEGIKVPNDDAEINMLGQLTSLRLDSLSELVHITRMVPKRIRVFQNLTNLTVEHCKSLTYLFSLPMANSLVALNILEVSNCESIEEVIEKEEEEGTSEITKIVFPKMTRLRLEVLSRFQMFCSQNYELECPLLEDLTIEQCPKMEKMSPWLPSATKLSKRTRERYKDLFRPITQTQVKYVKEFICGYRI